MPTPLERTAEVEAVVRTLVDSRIDRDPRTTRDDLGRRLLLGHPFDEICQRVLRRGLVDFNTTYCSPRGTPSAADRVLRYCYTNMKSHFFTAAWCLAAGDAVVDRCFLLGVPPVVLDFGCGPGTVALALADRRPRAAWDYVGIDSAAPMREKAGELWAAVRAADLVRSTRPAEFSPSWEGLAEEHVPADRPVLLVFSYFFASHTLTFPAIRSLAARVSDWRAANPGRPVTLVYVNSPNRLACRSYELFLHMLGLNPEADPPKVGSISYCPRRGAEPKTSREFARQTLAL